MTKRQIAELFAVDVLVIVGTLGLVAGMYWLSVATHMPPVLVWLTTVVMFLVGPVQYVVGMLPWWRSVLALSVRSDTEGK